MMVPRYTEFCRCGKQLASKSGRDVRRSIIRRSRMLTFEACEQGLLPDPGSCDRRLTITRGKMHLQGQHYCRRWCCSSLASTEQLEIIYDLYKESLFMIAGTSRGEKLLYVSGALFVALNGGLAFRFRLYTTDGRTRQPTTGSD